ncbi:energy-coupling factor ABC transporter ATP-binding protein [Chloroflexus aggregans]|uniref:ABC transporter ATP-binding protein n=1 Tax=Chloroflexus aggregans (strain MD-66 / DSM 9485) TaxID=326427 RepID=B8G802_CHLAD|nr:ABC transporter ATP-binding protein [Chloroflexus aggregans]ACL24181.1 cobalt ABC transporter, ATPase subunit [Chloroflexus aggregans DSM 9485]
MTALLALEAVSYRFPGNQTPALQAASLPIAAGQRIVVLGRNGAGKSTLLLVASGIIRPQQGRVWLHGAPVDYSRSGLHRLRRHVGLVMQSPDDQLFSASVWQDISFGPLNLGLSAAAARQAVLDAAAMCDVTDLLDRPTHALSGGQKARVALAGVLAMRPQCLLVDEATAGLDLWARHQVVQVFDRLVAEGGTVVLATHDLALARRWADLVVVLHEGRIVAVAPPAQVWADPELRMLIAPPEAWEGW